MARTKTGSDTRFGRPQRTPRPAESGSHRTRREPRERACGQVVARVAYQLKTPLPGWRYLPGDAMPLNPAGVRVPIMVTPASSPTEMPKATCRPICTQLPVSLRLTSENDPERVEYRSAVSTSVSENVGPSGNCTS